jgi:hypothetical protein
MSGSISLPQAISLVVVAIVLAGGWLHPGEEIAR